MAAITVIIPTRNEVRRIGPLIESLYDVEIIVSDGNSADGTTAAARRAGARVVEGSVGRGAQMNAGAAVASGEIFIFLHADTCLPEGWTSEVRRLLKCPGTAAGAFRLGIEGSGFGLRFIERCVDLRSRWLNLPYGDQAIFLRREIFDRLGGYRPMAAMEDYEFARRLAKIGTIRISPLSVRTGGRMWAERGVVGATLLNARCVAGYHLGLPPAMIAGWRESRPRPRISTPCPIKIPSPPRPSA